MDHFNRALNKNNNNNMIVHNNNNNGNSCNRDEREGCRSLICDANGIIIAEMVYRCMICSAIADSIADAKIHYHNNHIDNDAENGGSCSDPLMFPDESGDLDLDLSSEDENEHPSSTPVAAAASASSHSRRSQLTSSSYHHSSNTPLVTGSSAAAAGASGSYSFPGSTTSYHRNSHHHSQQHHHHEHDSMKHQVTSGGRKKIARGKAPALTPAPAAAAVVAASSSASSTPEVKIQTSGTNGTCTIKSGYITCPVCSCTKFYTTLQRRYGQFSCVGCYRFFKEFFVKPKRYGCPNLGTCPLDVRTKCKGCWIQKCIETYSVDEQRKSLLTAHRPVRKGQPVKSSVKQEQQQSQQQQSQVRVLPASNSSSSHNNNNNSSNNNFNNNNSSPGIDSGNENIEPDADGLGDEEDEDEEDDDQQYHHHQQLSTSGQPEAKRIKTEQNSDLMTNVSLNGTDEEEDENNSLEEDPEDFVSSHEKGDGDHDHGSSLLLPAGSVAAIAAVTAATAGDDLPFDSPQSSLMESSSRDATPPPVSLPTRSSGKTPPRRKTSGRIKNWCCLKCANCLADDCGKCINCLDRPKFGGPFIRKQRCLYKKCLMKTKPIPNNSSF